MGWAALQALAAIRNPGTTCSMQAAGGRRAGGGRALGAHSRFFNLARSSSRTSLRTVPGTVSGSGSRYGISCPHPGWEGDGTGLRSLSSLRCTKPHTHTLTHTQPAASRMLSCGARAARRGTSCPPAQKGGVLQVVSCWRDLARADALRIPRSRFDGFVHTFSRFRVRLLISVLGCP